MQGVRVIAGELKGRILPFANRKFDDADITTQKVKGAVFSMIGEYLHGKGFFDLYAGSGQIGIEALSRGADPTIINEPDQKRFQFIKSWLEGVRIPRSPVLLNLDDMRAIAYAGRKKLEVDNIFLDPPYQLEEGRPWRFGEILAAIADSGVLRTDGSIIIQHYYRNELEEACGPYRLRDTRTYGKTSLSVYR